ncbi:hypothetical protein ACU4GD_17375 [Cupriavidus basilensis]
MRALIGQCCLLALAFRAGSCAGAHCRGTARRDPAGAARAAASALAEPTGARCVISNAIPGVPG